MEEQNDHVNIKIPPPILFLAPLLAGVLISRAVPVVRFPRKPARTAGLLLTLVSLVIGGSAFAALRRHGVNPDPGMPVPTVVKEGPYRYTRNPIYSSFFLIYSGIALLTNSFWSLSFLPGLFALLNRLVVRREEAYLEQRFGPEYTNYKQRVPRWI